MIGVFASVMIFGLNPAALKRKKEAFVAFCLFIILWMVPKQLG
jgi:hypothetical protein